MSKKSVMYFDVDGTEIWWLDGRFHRTDGPAVIRPDGGQEWWVNNQRHRTDGPAVIETNGKQAWWVNGKLHRLDGPAVIEANGTQVWFVNGDFHRTDGPAYIGPNNENCMWCKNGKNITNEIAKWMLKHNVTWPWDDETQAQFLLTFS